MSRIETEEKPIKVLMVLPNLRPSNGVTNFVMNYFRGINHNEVQIDFATLSYRESPYLEEVQKVGSKVFILPSLARHPVKHIKKCREIIENGNYDIVHDNTLIQSIPIMWMARKQVKARLLHSHSTKMGESGLKERINCAFMPFLINIATHYSACSTNAGKAMFGERTFSVIPNVIDTSKFLADNKRRELVRKESQVVGKKVIGTVGRLAEPKNPFFAFDVFEEVIKSLPNVEYWWIGSGPLDEYAAQYIEKKGLSKKVHLLGSRDNMPDLYSAMDVFFLPSKFEGFGLACIEAEAAGLPCVISSEFPQEVDLTGNVKFLPLTADKNKWAHEIISALGTNVDRVQANEICRNSYFSRNESGNILVNEYKSIIKRQS